MKSPRSQHQTRGVLGFSLIELFIAIAIISVLAALLLGVTGATRRKAQVAQSVTNLRTIVAASLLFANENSGRIALYGDPVTPSQTQGSIVDTRGNQMPRALYPKTSPLGGHSRGGGDYLFDSMVFHNPRLKNFTAPVQPTSEFGRAPDGRQNIGYFYYSLPSVADPIPRQPMVVKGNLLSNDRPLTCWGRTPLYSDVPDKDLSKAYGFDGDELVVGHLDGSISVRSKAIVFAQSSLGWRLYYMATGDTQ